MQKAISLSIILFLTSSVNAQILNYAWSHSYGGTSFDLGQSVTTDLSENVIASGAFYGTSVNFGSTTLVNSDISGTSYDIYIVKFDVSGNVLWAKSAGGIQQELTTQITTDISGNIIITGYFDSPTMTIGTSVLINSDNTGNSNDIFVAKYDASGTFLWASSAGAASSDGGLGVVVDQSGNVFVTGFYIGTSIAFGNTVLTSPFNYSQGFFIVKYDSSGAVVWAKNASGATVNTSGENIAMDPYGNLLVTGYFYSDTAIFGNVVLTNTGPAGLSNDIFIVKYDSAGSVLWAKSAGGTFFDQTTGVSADPAGNVFITGHFSSAILTFGSNTITNPNNNSGNSYDSFIAKYDSAGNALWANAIGGINNDFTQSVATDASGNAFIIGNFQSPTITFGTTTLNTINSSSGGGLFIAGYGSSGNLLWAKSSDAVSDNIQGQDVTVDPSGNLLITGYFHSPSITLGSNTLMNADNVNNTSDTFIAKLDKSTSISETAKSLSPPSIYPNPTAGIFQINYSSTEKTLLQLNIVDSKGEKVFEESISQFKGEYKKDIDLSKQAKGVYFIEIIVDSNREVKRIVLD